MLWPTAYLFNEPANAFARGIGGPCQAYSQGLLEGTSLDGDGAYSIPERGIKSVHVHEHIIARMRSQKGYGLHNPSSIGARTGVMVIL